MLCVISIELPTEVQRSHVWLMDMDLDMNMLVFSSFQSLSCVRLCPSRNLYAGQEATVRTGHGTTD